MGRCVDLSSAIRHPGILFDVFLQRAATGCGATREGSSKQRMAAGESLTLLDVREPNETAYCKIDVPATAGC